ncbi:MAG TPA: 2,3-diaminopropionate biosynthesis protein SbnB [Bryobacteraceae bacterium]|nr:2,3-diaminopropionate biosynthesis protein SbnB [Bryobacteraceae bacterium]
MGFGDLLLLRGDEIVELFRGRERSVVDAVKCAYQVAEQGDCSIPNCPFLRFPGHPADRIIPKPAFLGGGFQVAGIKWIGSFPGNLSKGLERASATVILNSMETGIPEAVMEGSVISAYRTAASAALAAEVLGAGKLESLGVLGCGLISFETVRFLRALQPELRTIRLMDLSSERAAHFRDRCRDFTGDLEIEIVADPRRVFAHSNVVAIATTAVEPYLEDLGGCSSEATILHTSLRDLKPQAVLMGDNVVDDIEHACSNATSLDLTVRQQGNRDFVRATIGAVLLGKAPARVGGRPVIFSPFGLGVLDLATAHLARTLAMQEGAGTRIDGFLPTPWTERHY